METTTKKKKQNKKKQKNKSLLTIDRLYIIIIYNMKKSFIIIIPSSSFLSLFLFTTLFSPLLLLLLSSSFFFQFLTSIWTPADFLIATVSPNQSSIWTPADFLIATFLTNHDVGKCFPPSAVLPGTTASDERRSGSKHSKPCELLHNNQHVARRRGRQRNFYGGATCWHCTKWLAEFSNLDNGRW